MSEILKFDTSSPTGTIVEEVKLFELIKQDAEILQEVLPEFDFTNPPVDPTMFASTLVETCKHHNGLGLSANQCGFKYRVFVMGSGDQYVAHFNPKIIKESNEVAHMSEGCLSYPFLFLNITRPASVDVEYQDHTGVTRTATYTGISARCFQHELDHMNGIVYTARAKPLALKMGVGKLNKLKSKFRKANERMAKRVRNGLPKGIRSAV